MVQGLQGACVEQLAPFGTAQIPITLLPLQPGVQIVDGIRGLDSGKVISCAPVQIYVQRD